MKKSYVADPSTLCGAEKFTFTDGKAKGVNAVRMFNGKLDLTVVTDRCMDIFRLFYKGTPVSYVSKNGLVSPALAETNVYGFLNSFDAGFMYTCGLDNIGAPTEKNGRVLPQHGSISYVPAENVRVETLEKDGEYYLSLKGTMYFTALFGQKLAMRREIQIKYLGSEVTVRDEITNEGYAEEGYVLMYHTNVGYPFLSETAELTVNSRSVEGISAIHDVNACLRFEAPTPCRQEEVYRHDLHFQTGKQVFLKNGNRWLAMEFDAKDFPYLLEWKSMACGDYVLGLEPVTTPMPEKRFRSLQPGETAVHSVTWRFCEE
ncbi:MAG: aldose 1-epimerase family protein [Candidatus Fimimonas sp.]